MMKVFLSILFTISFSLCSFASYQYGSSVFWDQQSETNTNWNFKLTASPITKYDAFGVYRLSEGFNKQNAIVLNEGDNFLHVTENLGFWASSNRYTYTSESTRSNPFSSIGEYTVKISDTWFMSSYITISASAVDAPTGQPLPGILATMAIGVGVFGVSSIRKRKKQA